MEKNLVKSVIRINDIKQKIAWISSEYTKLFPTDPADLDMVSDNDRFHCEVLLTQLHTLVDEMKFLSEMTYIPQITLASHNKIIEKLNTKLLNIVSPECKKDFEDKTVTL